MWTALSSSVSALLLPSHLLSAIILLGIVLLPGPFKRWGWRLIAIGCVILVTVGILPIGNALIWALEKQFADWSGATQPTTIVVVQGSNFSDLDFTETEYGRVTRSATNIALLARRFPQVSIHYIIADMGRVDEAKSHAESLKRLIQSFDVAADKLKIETGLADLAAVAQFCKETLPHSSSDRWLLVTSAIETPLLMNNFRQHNLPVEAYPVERRIKERKDFFPLSTSIPASVVRLDIAVHEWARLLANRLTR